MSVIGIAGGLILIIVTLLDGFETILQPRRVTHRFRFARMYYRHSWSVWHAVATRIGKLKWREAFLVCLVRSHSWAYLPHGFRR